METMRSKSNSVGERERERDVLFISELIFIMSCVYPSRYISVEEEGPKRERHRKKRKKRTYFLYNKYNVSCPAFKMIVSRGLKGREQDVGEQKTKLVSIWQPTSHYLYI